VSRVIWAAFMLCIGSCIVSAQREPLTNSDVVAMFRFGLSEQTIVRSVQQGRTAFDISPDALIKMKRVGLSDNVVNAMLRSAYHLDGGHRKSPSGAEETVSNQSLALNGLGARSGKHLLRTCSCCSPFKPCLRPLFE
jgi:hypothetical protein